MIISIDGPAASGKSTTAKLLSDRLNYIHLNTGLFYRAVTYIYIEKNLFDKKHYSIDKFFLNNDLNLYGDKLDKVIWNNLDITKYLYNEKINSKINVISNNHLIRKYLVDKQRNVSLNKNIVCEGRDIGTVVFPNAKFKFYLNASINSRIRRRYKEFNNNNIDVNEDQIKKNLIKRDANDINRKISPLKKADDAIEIDTTNMTIEQQVENIYNKIKQGIIE